MSEPIDPSPVPIPAVSGGAYERAAKVRIRIAGSDSEGAIYQGQNLIVPCRGCGSKSAMDGTGRDTRGGVIR